MNKRQQREHLRKRALRLAAMLKHGAPDTLIANQVAQFVKHSSKLIGAELVLELEQVKRELSAL